MARSFGYQKIAEDLAAMFEADLRQRCEWQESENMVQWKIIGIESPIEWMLYFAMREYCQLFIESHGLIGLGFYKSEDEVDFSNDVNALIQARVGKYRVDFMFLVLDFNKEVHRLVVECDGHDFHERTKEQAAHDRSKDRSLQAAGYVVMRFTGREIYMDPLKCVKEILDWARKKQSVGFSIETGGDA